ncbi:MAG: recG [Bacteriovoracaceae bacterium]|nr:recG [Bacteriovoracaceae bacterium]
MKTAPTEPIPDLQKSLRYIKGVGEYLATLFAKKEVNTIQDALYFLPRAYEDRREITPISQLKPGQNTSVLGKIHRSYPVFFSRSKRRAHEVLLDDPDGVPGRLKLTWFKGPFQKEKLTEGTLVLARGEIKIFRTELQMVHPDLEILGKKFEPEQISKGIIPIYSETLGLFQKTVRKVIRSVVNQYLYQLEEKLPEEILKKNNWPSLQAALRSLHFPAADSDIAILLEGKTPAHERLIFEEFFSLSIGLALKRREYADEKGIAFKKPEATWAKLKDNLGFRFTGAQTRVVREILDDMTSDRIMHRLVQGDVGCGKTVVAAAAALVALEAGYQVALMAPTEVLIDQHFQNFQKWFSGMDIPLVRITGSMTSKEKKDALKKLSETAPLMVFGTHALFEDYVQFKNLGLVIVDEQHRFGVRQRAALMSKGTKPDVLVMTATPIPRTLALTLYGDLELSVIDELPPGRKPVVTKVYLEKQRSQLETLIRKQLEKSSQAYIVFPLIEDSEELKLKSIEAMLPGIVKAYAGFKVAHLHGRMKSEEKLQILKDFKENKIHVLVSTTVVEVGVDVPNATVMVIENAERFGLSQLHQLRGRIGRGADESFCFLMATHLGSAEIIQRLKSMETIHDGFKLAEVDLEMRGSGEFLGTKQSGLPNFQMASLPRDFDLLQRARKDAFELVAKDPELKSIPQLRDFLKKKMETVQLN